MSYDFTFENNADLTREQFNACLKRALTAIGMQAESYAKQTINEANAIDTGRMINSVTWATAERAGSFDYSDNQGNHFADTIGLAEEDAVYVGCNTSYAPFHEYGTVNGIPALHFLKNAAGNHTEEYKQILKQSMENA